MKDSSKVINILEKKLGEAEALALKTYEDKKIEIDTLKNSVKKSDIQAKNLEKNLETKQKVIKENEKLIQKLEQKKRS